jgi:phosphoenolpyruvate carboxylase
MSESYKKLLSTLCKSGGHYKKVISSVYSSLSKIHSNVADLLATFLESPKGRKLLPKINEKISNKILNDLMHNIRVLHEKAPAYQKMQ